MIRATDALANLLRRAARGAVTRAGASPSSDGPSVRRFLDLSTAHLPQKILLELGSQPDVVADPTPFGAWLWVPSDPSEDLGLDRPPPEVLAVQFFARSLGCDYVLFDADSPVVAGLPTFDWS